MKAVVCTQYGGPEMLEVKDIDSPPVGKGMVKIDVKAAGVNYPDALIIQGKYQFRPDPPFTPGGEVAGVISEVGEGVTNVKVGDRVLSLLMAHGGFAEQAVTPAAMAVPIPDTMPFDEAAGFLMTYGTTYHALKQRGKLQPGETLGVLGAAGGTGITAVELGKLMGAKVIACASSDEKLALTKDYGADLVINYAKEDLKTALKEATGGKGVDVIYDPVGGDYCEPAFRAMAWKGRFLVIGFVAGIPKLPTNLALLKGADLVGVFWGGFTQKEPELNVQNTVELLELYDQGKIKPHISEHFPLDKAPEAIAHLAARKAKGKVVVTMA
ncbi:MAG: NADPH:quinone oxidoreductase family protein [Pseudomonadota bacterium]